MKRGLHLAGWTLLMGMAPALAQAPSTDGLQQALATRFEGDRTGVCVQAAVVESGRVLRGAHCAGTRPAGAAAAPHAQASFEIGSVTKTMLALLVADLVQAGRWTLDDPIARHLPAGTMVPNQPGREILVRDLLTHRSGLPPLPPRWQPTQPANPYEGLTPARLLSALGEVRLAPQPIGSRFEYSNFGAMLLSLAVARAHGSDSLEPLLRSKLWAPLGMQGAQLNRLQPTPPAASGHLPGGLPTSPWTAHPQLAGVGMVRATLDDLVRYAQAQLAAAAVASAATSTAPAASTAGKPSSPALSSTLAPSPQAALRLTQQPLAPGFGMAWSITQPAGRTVVFHEGGTGGFSSLVAFEPAAQRAVVVLADTTLTDQGGLGDIGLHLLGVPGPALAPRRAVPLPPALREAMAGDYLLAGLPMRLWAQGDVLMAQAQGQGAFELKLDSRGDFYPAETVGVAARLVPLREGERITGFRWHQGGGAVVAERAGARPALTAQNPAWQEWAGEYTLAPQFALRVFEREGRLMLQGSGQPALAGEPTGPDRVEVKAVGAVFEFMRDATGRVTALTLRQGGQVLTGPKRQP